MGQGSEMGQEERYAAPQKEIPRPAPGQESTRHQYRLGGKRMTWAVHEPVTCPYGKGDQRPLELQMAEHHQQVQAGDPHLLPNSHIAEVLKGDMDMLD